MSIRQRPTLLLVRGLAAALLAACASTGLVAGPATADDTTTETDYGRMILVLDSSGSMAEPAGGGLTKIAAAKDALGSVIDQLPAEAYVGLRVFGATVFSRSQQGACTDSQLAVEPGTDNRAELSAAVASYKPYGETPTAHALRQAARDIGGEGRRSIVLVSDGEATCAPDPCDVAAELARKGIDLQIDVVGLGVSGPAERQLRCVAESGNGTYYDADSADDIVESLTTVATRAVRPYEEDGEPISGGPDRSGATPVTAGAWVDVLGREGEADGERWYSYTRTIPGSTVHATAYGIGGAQNQDAMNIHLTTEEGDLCGNATGAKQLNSAEVITAGTFSDGDPEACTTGDRIYVDVARNLVGNDLEVPFTLFISEEPPVDDVQGLPPVVEDGSFVRPARGTSTARVTGGASFAEAVEVEPGVDYAGDLVPGEVQVFKVEVDWGQSLMAEVLVPEASPEVYEHTGVQGPFASLRLFNPARAEANDDLDDTNPSWFAAGRPANSMSNGTAPVGYRNREGHGGSYLAGHYYIAYAADEDTDGETYEMPFTLRVDVQGEPSGAPAYAGGAEPVTGTSEPGARDEPSDEPAPEPSGSAAGDGESSGGGGVSGPVLAAGGLGLLALACLGVGALLLRRRG